MCRRPCDLPARSGGGSPRRDDGHSRLARVSTNSNDPGPPTAPRTTGLQTRDASAEANSARTSTPHGSKEEDRMKSLLAAIIGLAVAMFANPATAYVVEITTSIPMTSAGDEAQLRHALESAIDDVLSHAIAFTPIVVTLQSARVIGDRIYLLLLIADGDGEETMKNLSLDEPAGNGEPREPVPPDDGQRD